MCIVIFIWWSPSIPFRNLDEVFTYNHIWLCRGVARIHLYKVMLALSTNANDK